MKNVRDEKIFKSDTKRSILMYFQTTLKEPVLKYFLTGGQTSIYFIDPML